MKRKILSLLLALVMLVSLLPMTALATELTEEPEVEAPVIEEPIEEPVKEPVEVPVEEPAEPVASVDFGDPTGVKEYTTVQSAIEAAVEGVTEEAAAKTVKLIADVKENVTVAKDTFVILDLNDHVLTGTGTDSVITNKGTLSVTDSTMTGTTKTGTTRYFTDSKCAHGVAIGQACTDCGTVAVKDGCFETLETNYDPADKTEYKDYVKTIGGVITGGYTTDDGGGIYVSSGTATLTGISIVGNAASQGGGVNNKGTLTMTDCTVYGNIAVSGKSMGGGVFNGETLTMTGCIVSGNTVVPNTSLSGCGGGIENTATLEMTNCTVSDNTAKGYAGMDINSGNVTMTDCTVSDNTATGGVGGVFVGGGGKKQTVTMTRCTITGNSAGGYCGGVNIVKSPVTMTDCTVTGNTAGTFGGGVVNNHILTLKGKTTITGNKAGEEADRKDSNLYQNYNITKPENNKTEPITITDLAAGSEIGVSMSSPTDKITADGTEAMKAYFTSDNQIYKVTFVAAAGEGESLVPAHLELVKKTLIDISYEPENIVTYDGSPIALSDFSFKAYKHETTTEETGFDKADFVVTNVYDECEFTDSTVMPTNPGAYTLTVDVRSDDYYAENPVSFMCFIAPAVTVNDAVEVAETIRYNPNKDDTVTLHLNTDLENFKRVEVTAPGGQPTLLDSSNYDVTEGSIKVTLKQTYLKTLPEGEYTFTVVTGFKNKDGNFLQFGGMLDYEVESSQVVDISTSKCSYYVSLYEGTANLKVGSEVVGKFTVAKSGRGYTVSDGGYYMAYDPDGYFTFSDTPFVWSYDGGLYCTYQKQVQRRCLFWTYTRNVTTRLYLVYDPLEGLSMGEKFCPTVMEYNDPDDHCLKYKINRDGTHTEYCPKCGYVGDAKAHSYDKTTHYCVCGVFDPDFSKVTDVEVTKKFVTTYSGWHWWAKKVTQVRYTIKPVTENVGVSKVEYSMDGETGWKRGSSFTSSTELSQFYIRITDTNGKVTNWRYTGSDVVTADN